MKTTSIYLRFCLLSILCLLLPWNMYAGGPFKVTVKETTSGGPTGGGELCFNSQYIPCFTYNPDGTVSITFDLTFVFDPSRTVPDGASFQSKGEVYEMINGNPVYLPLSNGVSGQNYALGTVGTSSNREVDVSVTLEFTKTLSCNYYFTFWIEQINYTIAISRSGGTRNTNIISGRSRPTGPLFPYLNLPTLEATTYMTTCDHYCRSQLGVVNRTYLCPDGVDDNNDHTRFGQSSRASLNIYPNPSLDGNIILDADFGKNAEGPMYIRVLNTQGQLVFEQQLDSQLSKQKLSLSKIPPGIYFIYAKSGEQQVFEKFVKQ